MYIIDKHKDYYDYLSNIYGVDKRIVFDRRKSIPVTDEILIKLTDIFQWKNYQKKTIFLLLEIGFKQYVIQIDNVKFAKDYWNSEYYSSSSMKIVHLFDNNIHYFDSPMSIRQIKIKSIWNWKKNGMETQYIFSSNFNETVKSIFRDSIANPILKDTQITSLIEPFEIWRELQTYISSLKNDKNIDLPMTDIEKAEIHGFDKKTSFRNPIK